MTKVNPVNIDSDLHKAYKTQVVIMSLNAPHTVTLKDVTEMLIKEWMKHPYLPGQKAPEKTEAAEPV